MDRFRPLLAAALALTPPALAQRPPEAGSNNFYLYAQPTADGGAEELILCQPEFATTWSFPLTGPVARSLNRRQIATPSETEILLTTDSSGAGPIALVPVQVNPTTQGIEVFDFRSGLPTTSTVLSLVGGTIPYDLLEGAPGRVFVAEDNTSLGSLVAYEISLPAGGTPLFASSATLPQLSTPYATRLAIDPLTGSVAVPMINGVATITPGLPAVNVALTGALPNQPGNFIVGTNLEPTFTGALPESNLLCGLRHPIGSAVFAAGIFSCDGNAGNVRQVPVLGGVAPLSLAVGFHEIAIVDHPLVGRLATLLGFENTGPFGAFNPSGGRFIQVGSSNFGVSQVGLTQLNPVGNPEKARNATGLPVCALVRGGPLAAAIPGLGLVTIGTGVVAPRGTLNGSGISGANSPGDFLLAQTDRPLHLPGSDSWFVPSKTNAVTAPNAFVGRLVGITANAAGNNWIFSNPFGDFGQGLEPTTRPNILVGDLPPGYPALTPVALSSATDGVPGTPDQDYLHTGSTLGQGSAPYPNAQAAAPVPGPSLLGTENYQPVGPAPASFGARVPVFNFALALPFPEAPWSATPKTLQGGAAMVVQFRDLSSAAGGVTFAVPSPQGALTTEIAAY